jgi:hypothetical protein
MKPQPWEVTHFNIILEYLPEITLQSTYSVEIMLGMESWKEN